MGTRTIVAAIDLGPSTARVLYHAVGFARLLGAGLRVLHVDVDGSAAARERVLTACLQQGPYEQAFENDQIVIRHGRVSDAIVREARAAGDAFVVMGSRGHNPVTNLLLGSTSEAVLRNAACPVLLVPPVDLDIVNIGDRVALTCGAVMAAVDLDEDSGPQLALASELAGLASAPLVLMTVARSRMAGPEPAAALRARAHGLMPTKPRALIVRRGRVAEEISRCARAEGAGLIVMGLRAGGRGRPGAIAAAVLRTKRAFVLAVPMARPAVAAVRRPSELALIASTLVMLAAAAVASQARQPVPDVRAIVDFQRAADAYAFLHRQVEVRLELAHRGWQDTDPVSVSELASGIVARRSPDARLFTPRAVAAFREMAARAARAPGCDPGELRTGVWEMRHDVHASATGTVPLAPCISAALPALPDELEYRSAGTVLVVVDTHANLVVDVLPALLAGSELR